MRSLRLHLVAAPTLLVAVVGFLILLSPQFTEVRVSLGLPERLPGSRFNPAVGRPRSWRPGRPARSTSGG